MSPSIWQILIVALLVVLLFGRGKISGLMGDMAKGIKAFKKGMADDPEETQRVERREGEPVDVTPPAGAETRKPATATSDNRDV